VPTVTDGSDGGTTVSVVALIVTLLAADAVCAGLLLSVTVAVKLDVPLVVALPEITPDDVNVRPAVRLPDVIDQL
jgi:hypothetical protein